jgi:hypothetical protein
MIISALNFLVVMLACALNERMQKKLDYTQEEVRVLEEVIEALIGKKRIPLTNAQRLYAEARGR